MCTLIDGARVIGGVHQTQTSLRDIVERHLPAPHTHYEIDIFEAQQLTPLRKSAHTETHRDLGINRAV